MAAMNTVARARTAFLVNLAMVVEQANEQVLPAVYLFVGSSLSATPSQLGTLTLCRALVQTLASPLSGVLGDRSDRRLVLAAGAFIWGTMTSAIALSRNLHAAMVFAAANGLGLALLVPCCQSLVADLHPPEQRGRAFGLMQLTGALGGMAGSVFATNMGASDAAHTWGIEGWRLAFHIVAAVSILTGILVMLLAVDPRRTLVAAAASQSSSYSLLPATEPSPPLLQHNARHNHQALAAAARSPSPPPGKPRAHAAHCSDPRRQHASWLGAATGLHGPLAEGGVHATGSASPGGPVPAGGRPSAAPLGPAARGGEEQRHHHQHHQVVALGSCEEAAAGGLGISSRGGGCSSSCSFSRGPGVAVAYDSEEEGLAGGGGARCKAAYGGKPRRRGLVSDVMWVLRIPTFQAIVLQGIVGCFPWQAAVFFTLWLQLMGFKSSVASAVTATFGAGVALGALLGGSIGDRMARRLPDSGRIFTAQASVASGIPLTWLVLKGIPSQPALAADPRAYGAVLFLLGLTCTWAGAGCNSPIFAEIVPEDMRSLVYAFDRSLESSLAACAAPAVGLLAERAFGFSGAVSRDSLADATLRARNAGALGSSLLACMVVPWTACLAFYTVLHFTYRHDRRAAALAAAAEAECD